MAKVLELQLQHVLPMNIQGWFLLRLVGLISLVSKGLSRVFSNTTVSILLRQAFFMVQLTIAVTIRTFVGKVMSLLFNVLSRFVISCKSWAKSWVIEWARLCHCPLRINSLKTEELMMIHHLEIHSMIRYICQEMSVLYNTASFPIMLMVITIHRRAKNFRLMDIL